MRLPANARDDRSRPTCVGARRSGTEATTAQHRGHAARPKKGARATSLNSAAAIEARESRHDAHARHNLDWRIAAFGIDPRPHYYNGALAPAAHRDSATTGTTLENMEPRT